jgi:hypothetical protein
VTLVPAYEMRRCLPISCGGAFHFILSLILPRQLPCLIPLNAKLIVTVAANFGSVFHVLFITRSLHACRQLRCLRPFDIDQIKMIGFHSLHDCTPWYRSPELSSFFHFPNAVRARARAKVPRCKAPAGSTLRPSFSARIISSVRTRPSLRHGPLTLA